MLYLLPQLSSKSSLEWLERQWILERKFDPKLTYKAAFTLMAFKKNNDQPSDQRLISETVGWLASQQGDDFGWGPCKRHPVGSTPYCTGVALIGLLQHPELVSPRVFENALKWLAQNQLTEGLWSDHYIEEGSSWAFFALTQTMAYLSSSVSL
jgi:squalene cyclase